jgi:hypothetical protein
LAVFQVKVTSHHVLEVTTVLCQAQLEAVLHVIGGESQYCVAICLISFAVDFVLYITLYIPTFDQSVSQMIFHNKFTHGLP